MKRYTLTLFLVGIVLNSCSTSTNNVKTQPQIIPNINIELNEVNLTKGKSLYEARCGSCHQLFDKKDYDAVSWRKNVNAMYKRAKLNDLDKEFVYLYLTN